VVALDEMLIRMGLLVMLSVNNKIQVWIRC
jgi:hypothetical protein